MTPPLSTNEPGESHAAIHINVRFVSLSPTEIRIQHIEDYNYDHAMKHTESSATTFPSLFQIAAFFEDFFPAGDFRRSLPALRRLPFADLMSSPDKLMTVLAHTKSQDAPIDRPRAKSSAPAKRATRSARRTEGGGSGGGNGSPGDINDNFNTSPLKKVEFVLEAPAASSVKLAADFTDWEKAPVEMDHAEDGKWMTVVPLAPGQYAYRYIVDGQWFDDPVNTLHAPNPFGTENAVITVA